MNAFKLITPEDLAVEPEPVKIIREDYNDQMQARYHDKNTIKNMAATKKNVGTEDPRGVKDTDDHGAD